MASKVFTKAGLMLQKPSYFCRSSVGGSVPSRFLG